MSPEIVCSKLVARLVLTSIVYCSRCLICELESICTFVCIMISLRDYLHYKIGIEMHSHSVVNGNIRLSVV